MKAFVLDTLAAAMITEMLFPLAFEALKGTVSGVASWWTARFLDSVSARCPSCSTKFGERVENFAATRIVCPYCYDYFPSQHTCATPNTVKIDGAIVSGHLRGFKWIGGKPYGRTQYCIEVDVLTANSRDCDLAVVYEFISRSDKKVLKKEEIVRSYGNSYHTRSSSPAIYQNELPNQDQGLAVRAFLINAYNDVLHQGMTRICEWRHDHVNDQWDWQVGFETHLGRWVYEWQGKARESNVISLRH